MLKQDCKEQQKRSKPAEHGLMQRQSGCGPQIIRLIGELCGELKSENYATCTALWAFQQHVCKLMIDGEAYKKIICDAQEKKSEVQNADKIKGFISALYDQLRKDFLIRDDTISSYIGNLKLPSPPTTSNSPRSEGRNNEWDKELDLFLIAVSELKNSIRNRANQNPRLSVPRINPS